MNTRSSRLAATLAFVALASSALGMSFLGGGGFDLSWNTIDGGGGTSTGSAFSLTGTMGQPDAGAALTGGSFELRGGFWMGGGPSEEIDVATLTGLTMIRGNLTSGGIAQLDASDDAYAITRSGFGQTLIDLHNMQVQINANSDAASPSTVKLIMEQRINNSTGLGQVRMKNWNTNQFATVHNFALSNTDQVVTIPNLDAGLYVDDDGDIEILIRHVVVTPIFAYFFNSNIDQVRIEVSQ